VNTTKLVRLSASRFIANQPLGRRLANVVGGQRPLSVALAPIMDNPDLNWYFVSYSARTHLATQLDLRIAPHFRMNPSGLPQSGSRYKKHRRYQRLIAPLTPFWFDVRAALLIQSPILPR